MAQWIHTRKDQEGYDEPVGRLCELYQQAQMLKAQGVYVVSVDEKTGIQALERKAATPMRPGQVARQERAYARHGTQCLIANLAVATGHIIAPSVQETRTEADFAAHIRHTVNTDPDGQWVFIVDQLNTHQSESLARFVAKQCGTGEALGTKGKQGVLHTMETRRRFLCDPAHRIRFVHTPKHASWLNQIECWFSLISRHLLN